MDYVRVKSYAKINLTLAITGACGGYHTLDSVVATVDLADVITLKKRKKDSLVGITMHGRGSESIPYGRNNAVKAAEEFIKKYQTCGVEITVWKNIPMGAGLGGSSADVAGVLNGLKKLFGVNDDESVKQIADALGSDCGYMLTGGYARLTGRGENVTPIDSRLKLDIGITVPKSGVNTAKCYAEYDKIPSVGGVDLCQRAQEALIYCDKNALAESLFNHLYAPAVRLNGEIERAYNQLKDFAPLAVNMSGSGSAVYALFENDSFARYAQSRYRGDCEFILTKTVIPIRKEKNGGRKTD